MSEFTSVSSWQLTLSGVTAVDPLKLGYSSILISNPSGSDVVYVGPAKNAAGSALSSTTGFAIPAGTSIELDLTGSPDTDAGRVFSVVGTDTKKVHVLALQA